MDYDFITTCNWTSTGTFTLEAYRGTQSNVVTSHTLYYRKKGNPTWSSTTNGQINITSTGEWEVGNNWEKDGNNVLTHSYYGITAINTCTNVYFNEATLGTTVGDYFLYKCWYDCTNLVSMPDGFTLPQGITSVGNNFLQACWSYCYNLTSMPEGFNLPQNITSVGDSFISNCWEVCVNLVSMPEGFNLPQGIITVGDWFVAYCWNKNSNLTSMPEGFNLPQGITSVGDSFIRGAWQNCTGLETIPKGFNIPSGITSVGDSFFENTWYRCTKLKQDNYTEDLIFEFNAEEVFGGTCPITPDSIIGASKATPVYVAVNRPPDVTVDVEPDETVLSSSAVSVTEGAGVSPSANVGVTVFTNPSVSVTGKATIDLNTNEIVFTNPSVDVAVQANIIIGVSANETNLNSLRVNITGGEGISFDTSTDQAIFTNLAIKAVEQGGGYSPLASILNLISPEITVETEYNWYFPNKANSKWKKLEAVQTEWTKNSKIKTNWKKI